MPFFQYWQTRCISSYDNFSLQWWKNWMWPKVGPFKVWMTLLGGKFGPATLLKRWGGESLIPSTKTFPRESINSYTFGEESWLLKTLSVKSFPCRTIKQVQSVASGENIRGDQLRSPSFDFSCESGPLIWYARNFCFDYFGPPSPSGAQYHMVTKIGLYSPFSFS